MKRCPQCFRSSTDHEPLCVFCNASLEGVEPFPWSDPCREEKEWERVWTRRRTLRRKDLAYASLVYAAAITFLALIPGLIFHLWLGYYPIAALLVASAIIRTGAGRFIATGLQAAASAALIVLFGPIHPLTPFMLLGHIVVAMLFCVWVEGIRQMQQ